VDTQLSDLLADPAIRAIYIATPHDSHGWYARACLAAGKPVLCEKPLTPCSAQTVELTDLAQARQVFLMEALWTVFLPLYDEVRQWLREGFIGDVLSMDSSFCFETPYAPSSRLFNLSHAGGALLDIGIYNLAVTRLVLQAAYGRCPALSAVEASGVLAPTGVDQRVNAVLRFPQGVVSRFTCALDQAAPNTFVITGTRGEICIESPFWSSSRACLSRPGHQPVHVHKPWAVNGFEYEIEETQRCVRAGQVQSSGMPHSESVALVGWLDELRRQMGVRYPFEVT
jgi:predicted dehydrogenase